MAFVTVRYCHFVSWGLHDRRPPCLWLPATLFDWLAGVTSLRRVDKKDQTRLDATRCAKLEPELLRLLAAPLPEAERNAASKVLRRVREVMQRPAPSCSSRSCDRRRPVRCHRLAAMRFPATRRSVLERVRSADDGIRREAFGDLAAGYWKPSYHYLRLQWRLTPEEAEDAVQAFFATAFEKQYVERYDPAQSKFRTFLRVCLDRFVQNLRKAAAAEKRGGGAALLSLDFPGAERELDDDGAAESPTRIASSTTRRCASCSRAPWRRCRPPAPRPVATSSSASSSATISRRRPRRATPASRPDWASA